MGILEPLGWRDETALATGGSAGSGRAGYQKVHGDPVAPPTPDVDPHQEWSVARLRDAAVSCPVLGRGSLPVFGIDGVCAASPDLAENQAKTVTMLVESAP